MDREVREPCGSAFLCRLHIEPPSILDYTRCSFPGFVDDCLNRDNHEVRLTSRDPRRAAEEHGGFPTALDAWSDAKGRRVLERAPTRGAPTGGGRGARTGRHKACPYRDSMGLGDVVWRNSFEWEPVTNVDTRSARHVVGGGVAGAEPPHKGGRLRPTAQLQWSVVSGQWSEGARGTVSSVWVSYWMGGVGSSWVNSYELLILAQYHTYTSFL